MQVGSPITLTRPKLQIWAKTHHPTRMIRPLRHQSRHHGILLLQAHQALLVLEEQHTSIRALEAVQSWFHVALVHLLGDDALHGRVGGGPELRVLGP